MPRKTRDLRGVRTRNQRASMRPRPDAAENQGANANRLAVDQMLQ